MADDSSSLLRIDHIAGKGRGLVAAQPLKAGQLVLRESPLIIYSASPLTPSAASSPPFPLCHHCFRLLPTSPPSNTPFPCPSCSHHHFCSHKCLSTALKTFHSSLVCQTLSHLRNSSLLQQQTSERQVQARFVVAAYNLVVMSPSEDLQTFLSLHGTPDDSILDAAKFLHSLISPLFPSHIHISVDITAQLLAKDRINSFCLMNPYSQDGPQRSIKAYAIYPKATMFNHDCIPNACRFDYYVDTADEEHNTHDMVIRMIQDVNKGREVCISYFRISRDYCTRKRILMEDYGFICECDRCKIEANWPHHDCQNYEEYSDLPHMRFLSKYVCDRKNCNGTLAPLPPKDNVPSNVLECNFCGNFKIDSD
ncbi:hypothetical protein RIF29_36567 [Crotalaria pallida]|uniref:SET domain-containing protein n=1 Tax=Crotalaria pallida TaxID=3830 RepID=A0AAN9HSD1_CROPI